MGPPATAPIQVQALRERVTALESELRLRNQLLHVRQRVNELELEVKCKDALIDAREKREQQSDVEAKARAEAAEEPIKGAGGSLAAKLGHNWVSVALDSPATGQLGHLGPIQRDIHSQRSRLSTGCGSMLLSRRSTVPLSSRRRGHDARLRSSRGLAAVPEDPSLSDPWQQHMRRQPSGVGAHRACPSRLQSSPCGLCSRLDTISPSSRGTRHSRRT